MVQPIDLPDHLSLVEQPLHIRQHDQQACADQARYKRRQTVIGAEGDLLNRHRVVLVHDGNHLTSQEGTERLLGVPAPGAVCEIGLGEEDLRDRQLECRKRLAVEPHELPLPDRRAGLELRAFPWSPLEPQAVHPARNRPRTDHHNLMPSIDRCSNLLNELSQAVGVRLSSCVRQDAGANLHDETVEHVRGMLHA